MRQRYFILPLSSERTSTNTTITVASGVTTITTTTTKMAKKSSARATRSRALCCLSSLPPWRAVLTVFACMVTEATLGVTYTSGNLLPYLTSYLRNVTGETTRDYGSMLWLYNSNWLVASTFVCLLGLLERRIPNRIYILIGISFNAVSFFGTYWAIQSSFVTLVMVYGVVQGFAQSILYPNALNLALKWFPHRKGLISGITMGGYGGGAFIWNQITTTWINPHNIQPDQADGENRYFTQPELLHRVPSCFLLMGGVLISIQLLCLLSFSYPDAHPTIQNAETEELSNSQTDIPTVDKGDRLEQSKQGSELVTYTPVKYVACIEAGDFAPRKYTPSEQPVNLPPEKNASSISEGDSSPTTPHSGHVNSTTKPYKQNSELLPNTASQHSVTDSENPARNANHDVENAHFSGTVEEDNQPLCDVKGIVKEPLRDVKDDDVKEPLHDVKNDTHSPKEEQEAVSLVSENSVMRIPQYSPLDVLKQRVSYTLWLNNLLLDYAFLFIVAFYKAYGQTFIPNDHFLALVASFASVFNAIGRPIWGLIADRTGYLPAMLTTQGILFVSSATFLTCELVGSSAMFLVWVCLMFTAFSGIYSLQSPILFTLFGPSNFIFVLGLVTTTGVPATLTSATISEAVLSAFGWKGLFLLGASLVFLAILVLASVLVSCGHPIAPHMRSGLMVPARSALPTRHEASVA